MRRRCRCCGHRLVCPDRNETWHGLADRERRYRRARLRVDLEVAAAALVVIAVLGFLEGALRP